MTQEAAFFTRLRREAIQHAEDVYKATGRPQAVYSCHLRDESPETGREFDLRYYIVRPSGDPLSQRERNMGYEMLTVVDSVQGALL